MMTVARLSEASIAGRLRGEGLLLQTGPFNFRLRSPHALVAQGLAQLYADVRLANESDFIDFSLTVGHGGGLRRWLRPQARFLFDGHPVFEPLPADQAYPLLEWAMNWCISAHAHQYLIVHAAVVERQGCAVLLPAPPGSGKSTLCAALVHSGWRLLSDELALVSLADGQVWPLCRPVSLKNGSIEVIRRFAPAAELNRITHDTAKGSITHMKVPAAHLAQVAVPARPRWLVYPRYEAGAEMSLVPRSRASAMVDLARNAFNFGLLGETGFEALTSLVQACDCFDFRYSQLAQALAAFDALAETAAMAPGRGSEATVRASASIVS